MIKGRSRGFTLIEILIVVAIIGILAGFAWPAWQRYVTRVNRTEAGTCLEQSAQFMERFYTLNMRYDQDTGGTAVALPASGCGNELSGKYTIAIGSSTSNTYTLTATPQGRQASQDSDCGTLSLDNTGLHTVSGGTPANKCF